MILLYAVLLSVCISYGVFLKHRKRINRTSSSIEEAIGAFFISVVILIMLSCFLSLALSGAFGDMKEASTAIIKPTAYQNGEFLIGSGSDYYHFFIEGENGEIKRVNIPHYDVTIEEDENAKSAYLIRLEWQISESLKSFGSIPMKTKDTKYRLVLPKGTPIFYTTSSENDS